MAKAKSKNPSVMKLSQIIWEGKIRGGKPIAIAPMIDNTSPKSGGKKIKDYFFYLEINRPALFNCRNNAFEIVIEKNNVSCFLGHFCPLFPHCNTRMSGYQRQSVVDSIASHGNYFPLAPASLHNPQFVIRG